MKYDLREIMIRAWRNFRKNPDLTFSESLHRSWISEKAKEVNSKRIEDAKAEAGITTEEINTWAGWKRLGREVIHQSKALFGCDLIWGSRGDDAIYKARFFSFSQTESITE